MVTMTAVATSASIEDVGRREELEERRRIECRLTPARALESLEEAEGFLRDRRLLTLTPDCSLPSLFGACHEEPYRPGGRGFASWPRTKYPWGTELAGRPGVHRLAVHGGKGMFVTDEVAHLVDPLARDELRRAEAGEHGPDAERLVRHLAAAGPSLLPELSEELGLEPRTLRHTRGVLERHGAIVAASVVLEEPHRHTSELARWDQRFPDAASGGGLAELVVAGVRAAVLAPEREARTWFTWRAGPELVHGLVAQGRLELVDGALSAV
jgi:hypothetical protein